jgi:hypothetical protein
MMNDTAGTGIFAGGWETAQEVASPGFRRVGPMSALQAVRKSTAQMVAQSSQGHASRRGCWSGPDNVIRISLLGELLAHCAEVARCPQLGISVGGLQ